MKTVIWMLAGLWACGAAAQTPSGPAQAWEIAGTVRDASGPVKGVWVVLAGPENKSVRTGSQGRYSFTGARPGTYSIRVQKPDDRGEPRSRTVTVTSGQKLAGFDILLPKGAVIQGRVVTRDGQPAPGMVVVAYLRSFEQGPLRLFEKGGDITNDRGDYRIPYLPDGCGHGNWWRFMWRLLIEPSSLSFHSGCSSSSAISVRSFRALNTARS